MAETSTKPIVCTAEGRGDLERIWEISVILRGGEREACTRPYFIHYAEPTSPLKHPFDSLDKLLFCAEKGIPVVYSPAPMAGATAPITIAGHVAQGLAECLCGLVIHQLKTEGSPYIMGVGPAVMDMTTAQSSYNAPEYYLGYVAYVEMTHAYNLPSWGYAGTSDSQVPDEQASFEAGVCTLLSTLTGANLNHDVGYLDFGRTGSLEMIVLSDEMISMMRRMRRGIVVNDETLALEVIGEAGLKGDFLSHLHTMKHFSEIQWRPALMNRAGFDRWKQGGSKSLLERTREKLQKILETHQPVRIPEEKAGTISELVERFEPA
jgi:trimethylamine--corrinoid protein Co-methyltransferase